jgi:diazepam-binding inhibitor (GABA receptor modulating acyl-CoA-binding protein)
MVNSKEFLIAAQRVKTLGKTPETDELQTLYGYYKQATVGDINIEKPGFLNFKEGKKWEAWNACKGVSQYDAEVKYILCVNDLVQKYYHRS